MFHPKRVPFRLATVFFTLICLLTSWSGSARAQLLTEAWTAFMSNADSGQYDTPQAMTIDAAGNVYVAGNSLPPGGGFQRLTTIKYDAQGNKLWSASYRSSPSEVPSVGSLQVDIDGKVFLTGYVYNRTNAFVIKYDENGNQLSQTLSTNISFAARRIALQPAGAFALVGLQTTDTLVIENYDATGSLLSVHQTALSFPVNGFTIDHANQIVFGATSHDTNNDPAISIAKYALNGSLQWKTRYKGLDDGYAFFGGLTTDTNGNTFVVGISVDTNYFNSPLIVVKYDSKGKQSWVSSLDDGSIPDTIKVDDLGNLFLTDSGFTTIKCDSNGTFLWKSRPTPVVGYGYYRFSSPAFDQAGNCYLAGSLVKWGATTLAQDRVILKLDSAGNEIWAQRYSMGTNSINASTVVMTDDANNVYVTGPSRNATYFSNSTNTMYVTSKFSQTNAAGLPAITHAPESQEATAFTTVTFTVSAIGNGPLTYQWHYNNQPIAGQTNASLILTNIAENAFGDYSVVISNLVGWIKSPEAKLVVDVPPVFDEQPKSLSLALGESAALQVYVHGDTQLSVKWQHNGMDLPGLTTPTNYNSLVSSLVLSNVSLADKGNYYAIASNDFGMVTSAVAQVRISAQIHSKWKTTLEGAPTNSYYFYSGLTTADSDGNIYVSGTAADPFNNNDYLTVKLDSAGHQLWSKQYPGLGADDILTSMALDRWGNVYVTGGSHDGTVYKMATVKYDADGNQVWVVRDNGTNDSTIYASQIAVDDESNIVTAGISFDSYSDNISYVTTKYSPEGEKLWQVYAEQAGDSRVYSLALDQKGDILVAGHTGIIKYSSSGTELWRSTPYTISQVKTDTNNNVYSLSQQITADSSADYVVKKYNSGGNLLWSSAYAGTADANDYPSAMAVSEDGSVHVSGTSVFNHVRSYLTLKLNSNGQLLWTARFNDGTNSYSGARAFTVDASGNAYVTGETINNNVSSINTIKYDQNGNQMWATQFSPPLGIVAGTDVIVPNPTNIFVTAITLGSGNSFSYTVNAYDQIDTHNLPSISTPPQGQMVFINSNAVLSVTATGGPLQYQWRYQGNTIPGATNSTLTIPNFQPQDGGDYSVILDNGLDMTVSPEARLTPYTQLFSPLSQSTGQFGFTLIGERSRIYEIQRSSDLVIWDSVTSLFNTNGVIEFTAPSITNNTKAFYRAKKSH